MDEVIRNEAGSLKYSKFRTSIDKINRLFGQPPCYTGNQSICSVIVLRKTYIIYPYLLIVNIKFEIFLIMCYNRLSHTINTW